MKRIDSWKLCSSYTNIYHICFENLVASFFLLNYSVFPDPTTYKRAHIICCLIGYQDEFLIFDSDVRDKNFDQWTHSL